MLGPLPPLKERTLAAVARARLASAPDALAVRGPERSLSSAQLVEEAQAVAGGFQNRGIAAAEAVLLMLDNHIDYIIAWWALGLSGRIEVPVNTAYKGSILIHVVNNSAARAIVVDAAYLPVLAEVATSLTALELVIVRGLDAGANALAALPSHMRMLDWRELRGPRASMAEIQPWDLMGIMYTSGTTGPSKGVRVTHAHAYGYASPGTLDLSQPRDVALCNLPLFHIGGQWAIVYNNLIAGGHSVILPRFSASTFWDDVRAYGCTSTMLLGAMANFLWRQAERPDDAAQPLRRVLMSPVIAQLADFQRRFGVTDVSTGYGLTEGSTITCAPAGLAKPGRCGFGRPDFDLKLVDEHDIEVADGQVGEMVVRSKDPWMVMDGYHDMPQATVSVWRNQWLHTGDAMRRETDGQYVFVDRMKDAVRRRGENVSSFEVEKEINEHPAVLESAVIAVASDATEDEIKACVVLRPAHRLDAETLLAFLDQRLPQFMVPRYVEFIAQMPKTPTEKIRKQALRDLGVTSTTYDRLASTSARTRP